MNIDLTGKTALVTGSTEGIGFATARALAEAGAAVIVNGRGRESSDTAAAKIGHGARGVAANLADAAECAALFDAVPHADIVVSNAGIYEFADFFDADDALWDRHWQVNVMAGVRLARHYLPLMQAKSWGRFIVLGSESSFNIPSEMIHYGVSKTADVSLARGLAKRMAGTGVTVNSVLPGPTLTDRIATLLTSRSDRPGVSAEQLGTEFVTEKRGSSIIRRMATVEEVANMILYIASPLSSATTGASLRVDGGVIDSL
jgi:NAD(P)-dependent dehydrogenase (short-subunit alcohol dehydrogenase family)